MTRRQIGKDNLQGSLASTQSSLSMRGLFCSIAANGHGTPAAGTPTRSIDKHQRAAVAFASLHTSEILVAYKLCHRLCDRKQQRVGRAPSALRAPRQPQNRRFGPPPRPGFLPIDLAFNDLAKLLVSRKNPIQWLQLLKDLRPQWPTLMGLHESAKPFPQFARLSSGSIKFARHSSLAQFRYRLRWHHAGLCEPRNQVLPRSNPLDLRVHGSCDRIQKIQPRGVSDEDRSRTLIDHWNHLKAQPDSNLPHALGQVKRRARAIPSHCGRSLSLLRRQNGGTERASRKTAGGDQHAEADAH